MILKILKKKMIHYGKHKNKHNYNKQGGKSDETF